MSTPPILLILPSSKRGGVPFTAVKMMSCLQPRGFVFDLVVPDDGEVFGPLKTLARTTLTPPLRGFFPRSLLYIRRHIIRHRIQVVSCMGRGAGLYGRLAAIGTDAKVVYGYHGFSYRHMGTLTGHLYLAAERLLAPLTSAVVCVSNSERSEARAAGILPEGREFVIPNGIEPAAYAKPRPPEGGFTLGTLSRISIQKDLETLVAACRLLMPRYPELRLHIAGGTQPEERPRELRIRAAIKDAGLSGHVSLDGEVADVPGFLASIDVYASSSLWEGLPGAILEAFAAQVPVVATAVTGNDEIVRHEETGLLVPPRNPEALAAAVSRVFEDRSAAQLRAKKARDLVSARYSMEAMAVGYARLYSSLERD